MGSRVVINPIWAPKPPEKEGRQVEGRSKAEQEGRTALRVLATQQRDGGIGRGSTGEGGLKLRIIMGQSLGIHFH